MVSFECCEFLFFLVGKTIHFVGISFKQYGRIVSMSLFKYFAPVKDIAKGKCSDYKLQDIDDNNKTGTSCKRAVYKDVDKIRIDRYTCENGNS